MVDTFRILFGLCIVLMLVICESTALTLTNAYATQLWFIGVGGVLIGLVLSGTIAYIGSGGMKK